LRFHRELRLSRQERRPSQTRSGSSTGDDYRDELSGMLNLRGTHTPPFARTTSATEPVVRGDVAQTPPPAPPSQGGENTKPGSGASEGSSATTSPTPLTPNPSPARGEGSKGTPNPSPARGEGSKGPSPAREEGSENTSPARGERSEGTPNPSPARGEGSEGTPDRSPARGDGSEDTPAPPGWNAAPYQKTSAPPRADEVFNDLAYFIMTPPCGPDGERALREVESRLDRLPADERQKVIRQIEVLKKDVLDALAGRPPPWKTR
jgi:hypothetical protein